MITFVVPGDREEVWQSGQSKSKHKMKFNIEKCSERKGKRISFLIYVVKKKGSGEDDNILRGHGNFTGGLVARIIEVKKRGNLVCLYEESEAV